jgi:hypothetical protein
MSESWSEVGRQDEDSGHVGTAWSVNGKGVADAPEAAIGAAEPETETAVSVVEADADTAVPADDVEPVPDQDVSHSFLSELARAMQATAGQERDRAVADTERRRTARIDEIRARETAEADRMRELAAEDQTGIDSWAETEVARIKAEQERRSEALRADLETSLGQHRELIAQEIQRVETAVAGYRTEVETFFDALERETDPVAIAQLATSRPVFPSLDTVPLVAEEPVASEGSTEVGETAAPRDEVPDASTEAPAMEAIEPEVIVAVAEDVSIATEALEVPTLAHDEPIAQVTEEPQVDEPTTIATVEPLETPLVGVMDYSPDLFGDPWRDLPEKSGPPAEAVETVETEATASAAPEEGYAEAQPEVQAEDPAAATSSRGRSVLQAVPALRPMGSWLGRHANSDRPDLHG